MSMFILPMNALCWFLIFMFPQQSYGNTLVDETIGKTIVAFGDSLTEGYWKRTTFQEIPEFHAYAIRLQNLLKNQSNMVQVGISGERTTSMVNRLPIVLKKYPETKLVIILGGTNDLGSGQGIDQTILNLKSLHRIALNSNSMVYTIAITIPQAGWMLRKDSKRLSINQKIRAFVDRCSTRMTLLDMDTLPFDLNLKDNHEKYWSPDLLHLNPHGYDVMGEYLHKTMLNYTINSINPSSTSSSSTKPFSTCLDEPLP